MSVYLKVPSINDLKYRKIWMEDKNTMEYNAGYDLNIDGYSKESGIIIKSNSEIIKWYKNWIGFEPNKYFAYIYDDKLDEPVGEVYFYKDGGTYDMGIIISSVYRGKGYSILALVELQKVAFEKYGINELTDYIPVDRVGAINSFKKSGFIVTDVNRVVKKFDKDELAVQLKITKEMYYEKCSI